MVPALALETVRAQIAEAQEADKGLVRRITYNYTYAYAHNCLLSDSAHVPVQRSIHPSSVGFSSTLIFSNIFIVSYIPVIPVVSVPVCAAHIPLNLYF